MAKWHASIYNATDYETSTLECGEYKKENGYIISETNDTISVDLIES